MEESVSVKIRQASCSCGQLRLICQGEPARVGICHCGECQRRTGSAFSVQALYPRDQVQPPEGIVKRYARVAESGRTVNFGFCPECGGTVFWEAEMRPDMILVAVGTFADPGFERPSLSVWERTQHPWTKAMDAEKMDHSQ
jgi:hypothetical protein